MLPTSQHPQNDKGVSAWDRYAFAEIKRILVIFIVGILVFEVAALYAFEQINLVQFLLIACVLLFLLIFHVSTLSQLYAEQLEFLPRQRLLSAHFGLHDEQIISRTTIPGTPPPRFSA